jgi:glucokinase
MKSSLNRNHGMEEIVLGIDIGGTNTKFGWVDSEGRILVQANLETTTYAAFDDLIRDIHSTAMQILPALQSAYRARAVGIGAPNGNYYKGTIEFAPNLKWKGILPVTATTSEIFRLPAFLTNDANAAAIGEMKYGGAKGMKDFLVVTLGTGVGSGFVVNGEVMYGHDGFAGELGHIIVDPHGRPCGCGRKGCLETYASAKGIYQSMTEILEKYTEIPCVLREQTSFTARDITLAATRGDQLCLLAFEELAAVLGAKLADIVAITSPEAIFLFGGLAQAGDTLFVPLKKHMEDNLLVIFKDKVKIMPSVLSGSDAAILGASALAWMESERLA